MFKIKGFNMKKGTLYLIPCPISSEGTISSENTEVINLLEYFIVERVRTARRFIRKCLPDKNISDLTFFELDKNWHHPKTNKSIEKLIFSLPNSDITSIKQI